MKVARTRRALAGAGASCLGWLFGRSDLQWQGLFGFGIYTLARWMPTEAAIVQLGKRQTEDLKVPSSILGLGMFPPAPAPRVGLGGRNLSCGGGQGGCKACVFADPAACPLHAAPCYLGPRQRAGARRRGAGEGGGVSRPGDTLAGHPKQARGSSGPPQEAPSERDAPNLTRQPHIGLRDFMRKTRTHQRRPSSEGGGPYPKR